MEFDKAIHRAFNDFTKRAPLGSRSFGEDTAKVVCYRADEVDRIFTIACIISDVASEERPESSEY